MSDTTAGQPTGLDPSTQGHLEVQTGTTQTFEIDGQAVTLEELQAGYMRQSDYTRKTQDVANQRKELEPYLTIQSAFEQDPQAAMQTMGEIYGVSPVKQTAQPSGLYEEDQEQVDPVVAQLMEQNARMERQLQALTTNQSAQIIDQELQKLATDRGLSAEDAAEVKRHAITNQLPSLELAYKDLYFEAAPAQQVTPEVSAASDDAAVLEAKRAAGVVSTGPGISAGSTAPPPPGDMDVATAFRAAMAEHQVADLSQIDFGYSE